MLMDENLALAGDGLPVVARRSGSRKGRRPSRRKPARRSQRRRRERREAGWGGFQVQLMPKAFFTAGSKASPRRAFFGDDLAGAVQEEGGGDAMDAILDSQVVGPVLAVVILPPGHVMLLGEADQFVLVALPIEADADDLEALGVIFLIDLGDIGDFPHARAAPGRPKINHHHLAFVGGDGKGLAIEVLDIEIGENRCDRKGVLNFSGLFALLDAGENLVHAFGRAGIGEVALELFEHLGAFVGLLENLDIKGGFHKSDLGHVVAGFSLMLGQQGVELLEVIGLVGFGHLALMQAGVDAGDQVLQFGGGGAGSGGAGNGGTGAAA